MPKEVWLASQETRQQVRREVNEMYGIIAEAFCSNNNVLYGAVSDEAQGPIAVILDEEGRWSIIDEDCLQMAIEYQKI